MAKKRQVRLACRALDYLVPVHPPDLSTADAAKQHFLESSSGSPARSVAEARSDLGFVSSAVDALIDLGVDDEDAAAAAAAVLAFPTIAIRATAAGETLHLHAAVLAATGKRPAMQVTLRLRSDAAKPPLIELVDADATQLDLDDQAEQVALVAQVETWWREHPMPAQVFPDPLPLPQWAWLGDLTWAGLLEVPVDWRERLQAVGGVYGRTPLIAETRSAAEQYKVAERAGFAVAPPSAKWSSDVVAREDRSCELESVGEAVTTFADLLDQVRGLILAKAQAGVASPPPSRDLAPGEVVYHRKVGNSRAFDRFDAGTDKPCMHGADGFKPFRSADKASKGMARRYDNYTPAMLTGCGKYPNCHVYAVDAARGGLAADGD